MEENKNSNLKKIMLFIGTVVLIAILVVLCAGYTKKATTKIQNPIATMEVEKYGTIKLELYPEKAPNTVANFIKLANNGVYNGLKFHRVVKDFMIQGGDPQGTGSGKITLGHLNGTEDDTEYCIKGEFMANGFKQNNLNLTEGVIAMARQSETQYSQSPTKELYEAAYNSAGSQFFIMTTNSQTGLSGYYAGFGKVIEGMDIVKKISEVKVVAQNDGENKEENTNTEESKPKKDVKIKNVTVDTFGIDYGTPQTMEPFNYMNWLYSQYGISN